MSIYVFGSTVEVQSGMRTLRALPNAAMDVPTTADCCDGNRICGEEVTVGDGAATTTKRCCLGVSFKVGSAGCRKHSEGQIERCGKKVSRRGAGRRREETEANE